jgi:tetratricopeptide (TPR) repeat protein
MDGMRQPPTRQSLRLLAAIAAFRLLLAPSPGFAAEEEEEEVVAPEPKVAAPASGKDLSPAEMKVETSLKYRKVRRYDEAMTLLGEALALDPPPAVAARILFRRGETLFKKAQDAAAGRLAGADAKQVYAESLKALGETIERHPREEAAGDAAYLIGSCHVLLDDTEKALAAYQRTFDEFPAYAHRASALLRIGICHASLGDVAKARAAYARLMREFPDRKAEVEKARRYLTEVGIMGERASPIAASSWLQGLAADGGLKTFEGEVIVLVFFATWCKSCSAEIPHLRSLMKDLGEKGIVFLGIANPDDPQNVDPVDLYVRKNELPFLDVALDRTEASWAPYRVGSLPAAVLIDRQGTIRWRGHPAFFPRKLAEKINEDGAPAAKAPGR